MVSRWVWRLAMLGCREPNTIITNTTSITVTAYAQTMFPNETIGSSGRSIPRVSPTRIRLPTTPRQNGAHTRKGSSSPKGWGQHCVHRAGVYPTWWLRLHGWEPTSTASQISDGKNWTPQEPASLRSASRCVRPESRSVEPGQWSFRDVILGHSSDL